MTSTVPLSVSKKHVRRAEADIAARFELPGLVVAAGHFVRVLDESPFHQPTQIAGRQAGGQQAVEPDGELPRTARPASCAGWRESSARARCKPWLLSAASGWMSGCLKQFGKTI